MRKIMERCMAALLAAALVCSLGFSVLAEGGSIQPTSTAVPVGSSDAADVSSSVPPTEPESTPLPESTPASSAAPSETPLPSETPGTGETPAPTETPQATATPMPTPTPAETPSPSAMPEPSGTPAPTATPAPAFEKLEVTDTTGAVQAEVGDEVEFSVELNRDDVEVAYDGTTNATVTNLKFRAADDESGVVAGDKVAVTPDSFAGVHSVIDQTDGKQVEITRRVDVRLSLSNNELGDYYIASEEYTGAVLPRSLHVHSLYLDDGDDANNPRNIKQYDGTDAAVISDILIDGIIDGDEVWVDKDSYAGTYYDGYEADILDYLGVSDKEYRIAASKWTDDGFQAIEHQLRRRGTITLEHYTATWTATYVSASLGYTAEAVYTDDINGTVSYTALATYKPAGGFPVLRAVVIASAGIALLILAIILILLALKKKREQEGLNKSDSKGEIPQNPFYK